jgi:hypothetical protein
MNSVSGSAPIDVAAMGYAYGLTVAKKQLDATQREGAQTLELIQAATPPPAPQGSLGHRIDVRA